MKGKPDDGICFVTGYLSLLYDYKDIEGMSREQCLNLFKTLTNGANPVPEFSKETK